MWVLPYAIFKNNKLHRLVPHDMPHPFPNTEQRSTLIHSENNKSIDGFDGILYHKDYIIATWQQEMTALETWVILPISHSNSW